MANGEPLLFSLDMNVAGAGGDAFGEQLVHECDHGLSAIGDGRLSLVLFLPQHLDVEQAFRFTARRFAAIELVDAMENGVAIGEVKYDVAAGREGERVFAFNVARISRGNYDLAIAYRQRKDAVLAGPALWYETGGVFSGRI